jgi:O-antigen chain-terminating methyltransferase
MATVAGLIRWLRSLRSLNAQRQVLADQATELGRLRVDLAAIVDQRERDIGELAARLSTMAARMDQDSTDAQAVREGVRRELTGITEWLGRLGQSTTQLAQADRDATQSMQASAREFARQIESVRARLEAIAPSFPTLPNLDAESGAAWFHAAIESAFRGPEAEIRKRFSAYLPYVTRLPREIAALTAVDIGCGRGEWLRELNDAGMTAIGVDSNPVSVERCVSNGLKVVREDAITYLRHQVNESLGVVSAFHVIEHLATESLIALLIEAHRVLAPGGLLLLETPNPDNVLVGATSFYLDPTHRHPIPAPLLRVMLEFAKFDVVESLALQPNDEMREFAQAEHWPPTLLRLLAGPRDIGVVARKPGDGPTSSVAARHT